MDTGLVLSEEIEKIGGYDSLDIALRSTRRRACCTRSDDWGGMEYYFLSSRNQALNGPPQRLLQSCVSLKQNSTDIKDNGFHVEGQINAGRGHEHHQSRGPDHSSTIRQDDSNDDQGKHEKGKCHSQSQEEEGKSLDRPQVILPSSHLEGGGCVGVDNLVDGVKMMTLATHGNNDTQKKCLKAEESYVAVKENDIHVVGQVEPHLGHEHPQSGTLDHCSTSRKDNSYDQVEQEQQHLCQRQEEEGKSLDSSQDTLPSIRLEDSGDGAKTLMDIAKRVAKGMCPKAMIDRSSI